MTKRRILYLDDEAACLRLFAGLLGESNKVRTAQTLAQARAMLAERPAEIVISDQLIPEIEGIEFLREVAAKYPASCRVLLTGTVTLGHVMPEIGNGLIHYFLTKPWTEREMHEVLERADAYLDSAERKKTVFS